MSITRRLHLNDVASSFPEFGPNIPDGGYSWVVLFGVILIQTTVPSILTTYGVILGFLVKNKHEDALGSWEERIILTPILFTAFLSLSDPWSRILTDLALIPRLVGLIGVALLAIGVMASGYLATGGVGAYLASISAGASMGIGASFVIILSEKVLLKSFRLKLPLALAVKNISVSIGLIISPFVTHILLIHTDLKIGLLMVAWTFLPTFLATLILREPVRIQPPTAPITPYRLLLATEDDNELPIDLLPSVHKSRGYGNESEMHENETRVQGSRSLFGDYCINDNNIYQESMRDSDILVRTITSNNSKHYWKEEMKAMKLLEFWAILIVWIGMKISALFFWISLSAMFLTETSSYNTSDGSMLLMIAGFGTLLSTASSYWSINSNSIQRRKILFGLSCWISSVVSIGITYVHDYPWFVICALTGGISIGNQFVHEDSVLHDILGPTLAKKSHKALSTTVGLTILLFCFIRRTIYCLRIAGVVQFFGGLYWIMMLIFPRIEQIHLG